MLKKQLQPALHRSFLYRSWTISQHYSYWLMYILGGFAALLVALYHQHYLEEPPCVVCIQIRLWFTLLIILSITGLYLRNNKIIRSLFNLTIVLIAVAMIERSYLLLGTERGFIFADCGFDLGLPAWFAIGEWVPWLFRIEASCGYTPEVIFGITMAEALMVSSVLFFVLSCYVFITDLIHTKSQ
jgi:disulfide bond formation protein DsbB